MLRRSQRFPALSLPVLCLAIVACSGTVFARPSSAKASGPDAAATPARVQVSLDDDPSKGPAAAPVTIVEFSDFQCPFCSQAAGTVKRILENYKDRVRFVFRDFPSPSIHPRAQKAAEAAQCANEQGKYWEYHDALFADQSKLAVADLLVTAERLGLQGDVFKTCLDSGKYAAEVSKDMEEGMKAGVNGTPSFFINGIPVAGAQRYEVFSEIIDRELARPRR
jgi:protein-disulfide isomerase